MKKKTFFTGLAGLVVLGGVLIARSTDGYYVAAAIAFFVICAAYAEWCERL